MIFYNTARQDLLAFIWNGQSSKKRTISMKFVKSNLPLLRILFFEGFITSFGFKSTNMLITLKYSNSIPSIKKIFKISTTSRRIFISCRELGLLFYKYGSCTAIISTSDGLLSNKKAINMNVGGELLYVFI